MARLRAPWTVWPPARAVAARQRGASRAALGAALARRARGLRHPLDFAPVVDVDTNPKNPVIGDRSFGDDPEPRRAGSASALIARPAGRRRRRLRQALPRPRRHRARLAPRAAGGRPLALAARGRRAAAVPRGDRGRGRGGHDGARAGAQSSTTRCPRRCPRRSSRACCARSWASPASSSRDDLEMKAVAKTLAAGRGGHWRAQPPAAICIVFLQARPRRAGGSRRKA